MNNPFKKNKFEIIYHLIDCLIAFGISFLSAFIVTDAINSRVIVVSVISAFLIGAIKFRDYWSAQHDEYDNKKKNKNIKMRMIFI